MSNLDCPNCGRFLIYPDTHKCNPQWEVCFGPTVDEAINYGVHTVYAFDLVDAVEEAAEKDDTDSGEYTIVRNGEEKAWARKLGDNTWTELIVFGESVPRYTAHLVE